MEPEKFHLEFPHDSKPQPVILGWTLGSQRVDTVLRDFSERNPNCYKQQGKKILKMQSAAVHLREEFSVVWRNVRFKIIIKIFGFQSFKNFLQRGH